MDGAMYFQYIVHGVACGLDASDCCPAGVHDERDGTLGGRGGLLQQLECDNRVFATSYWDQVVIGFRDGGYFGLGVAGRRLGGYYFNKVFDGGLDAVDVEEFSQSIEVYLFPKGFLRVVKGTAQHFYNRGADTFPIAYKLYHSDVEHEGVHLGCVFGEVKETARRDESGGRENDVRTDTERKNDVQSVGLHIVSVAIIDKLGVCLTISVVLCLVGHLL
jgi:hypothetical protein